MEQYEKVHLKPYTLLFKTTIKGVTRQPQEKRVQNDKKRNLCTTFKNLN